MLTTRPQLSQELQRLCCTLQPRHRSLGTQQVSEALSKMQEVTAQTAAGAAPSAAAGWELSSQSQALKSMVARLASMV